MAVGDATIGLLFKVSADTSAARSDIVSLQRFYIDNLNGVEGILQRFLARTKDLTSAGSKSIAQVSRVRRVERDADAASEIRHQQRLAQIQALGEQARETVAARAMAQIEIIRERAAAAESSRVTRQQVEWQGYFDFLRRNHNVIREAGESLQNAGYAFAGLNSVILRISSASIESAGKIESVERAYRQLDKASSEVTLSRLREQAAANTLAFGYYAESVLRVRSVQKLTAEQSEQLVLGLTNVSRVAGVSAEQQERAINALIQILGKGKIQAEELRGQLLEAVPNLAPIIERRFGTLNAEILNAQNGAKGFVTGLISELGKIERVEPTAFEKYQVKVDQLKEKFAPLGDTILNFLNRNIDPLTNGVNRAIQAFDGLDEQTKQNVVTFGALSFAIAPVLQTVGSLTQIIGGTAGLAATLSKTNLLAGGLAGTLTTGLNPALLAVAGTLVGGAVVWYEYSEAMKAASVTIEQAAARAAAAQKNLVTLPSGEKVLFDPSFGTGINLTGLPKVTVKGQKPLGFTLTSTGAIDFGNAEEKPTPKVPNVGGGGEAGNARRKEQQELEAQTRDKLRLLELQEQAVSRLANAEVNAARRAFDSRKITLSDLEKLTVSAEERMLTAKLRVFAEERKQVESSNLKAREKTLKLETIAEREATARQQVAEKIAQIDAEREKREDAARQRSRDKSLAASDERTKAEIENFKREADQRVRSFEDAENKIIELELARNKERIEKAKVDFLAAGVNVEGQRAANDALVVLYEEEKGIKQNRDARINEARKKDLELERRYQSELRQIRRDAINDQIAADRLELEALERKAQADPRYAPQLIQARYDAGLREIALRQELANQRLQDDEDEAQKYIQTLAQKEEFERASYERRLEQDRLFDEERKALKEQQQLEAAAADPSSNQSIFGVSDESLSKLQAFGEATRGALATVSASVGNMRTILVGAFSQVASGLGNMLQGFILTGKLGPQAFKKLAAGAIAAIASQSIVKAVFELAEGFAALAAHDYDAASKHFIAAKIYGTVGAVAAGVGLGIGAAGGFGVESGSTPGTGGSNAGAATGAGAFNGTDARELVFRRPVSTEDTERAKLAAELRQKYEETGQRALLKLAEAVEGFRAKIEGMRPGDVVTVGLGERPQAAADAIIERASTDGGFVRRLSEAQGIG